MRVDKITFNPANASAVDGVKNYVNVDWRLALDDVVDLEDLGLPRVFECDVS